MTVAPRLSRTALLMGAAAASLATGARAGAAETPVTTAPPVQLAQATPASNAVLAAAAPVTQLEGVVVTAERRSTSLQKTPLSITAISGQALDDSFVNQLSDLSAKVPSLEITHASGFENMVTIRGVGYATPENSPTNVPGVAEFVDGVYIANTISLDETLFDVDHVEVLRGPQGALYGESADGGAISIVTKQPRLGVFDSSGDFSAGDYQLFRERVEVNVPVSDTVAVRLSAQAFDHEGFTVNEALPRTRLDDNHDMSGKLAILWRPNAWFSATVTGMVYHADENGAAQKNIIEFTPAVLAQNPSLSNPRTVYQDYPSTFDLTAQLYHVNLEWDLPWVVVKSVTAYQQLDHIQQEDSSRSALSIVGFYDDVAGWNTKLQNYNEELDLLSPPGSRLEWDVGGFAMAQDISQFVAEFQGTTANPNVSIPSTIQTNPPANLQFGQLEDVNRQAYAGFFQATYHVTPRLRLTAGARINHDSYTPATYGFSGAAGGGPNTPSPLHSDAPGYTDTVPTYRLEGDYDVTAANLVYASVSRGYKPGGVNANIDAIIVPHQFKYESNTAFEVGSKNTFLGRTVRLNAAAFYYDYGNFQYLEVDPFPFNYGTANVPTVHIYGVEGEGSYTTRDGRFRLNATAALENGSAQGNYKTIDSTVINSTEGTFAYPCFAGQYTFYVSAAAGAACAAAVQAAAIPIAGKHPPDMPKFSGSVNAAYTFDVLAGKLTPRAEFIYRGSEWARIFNDPALDKMPSYGVWNFNLDYVPEGSPLHLSLAVTNAFNIAGVNSRYTDPYGTGQTSEQFIPPRQVVGMIGYAF